MGLVMYFLACCGRYIVLEYSTLFSQLAQSLRFILMFGLFLLSKLELSPISICLSLYFVIIFVCAPVRPPFHFGFSFHTVKI